LSVEELTLLDSTLQAELKKEQESSEGSRDSE